MYSLFLVYVEIIYFYVWGKKQITQTWGLLNLLDPFFSSHYYNYHRHRSFVRIQRGPPFIVAVSRQEEGREGTEQIFFSQPAVRIFFTR